LDDDADDDDDDDDDDDEDDVNDDADDNDDDVTEAIDAVDVSFVCGELKSSNDGAEGYLEMRPGSFQLIGESKACNLIRTSPE
jgi:hypothetical protein